MPASNRRPLYDDADAPQASDMVPSPKPPDAAPLAAAGSTPTTPAAALAGQAFKQPCTFKGAASALYAGALGYFLGVVPATIKFKARQWGMIHTQGLGSAQQLAVMSGMYTAVHCICQRIRMVEDGWNRGIAGCSTGLVLGWSNGPWSALQSCAGLGLISALIDLGGGVEAAEARALQPWQPSPQQQQQQHHHHHHTQQRGQSTQEYSQSQQLVAGQQNALSGLPQPVQMLALLLGASPTGMGSSQASVAHPGAECSSSNMEQHKQGHRQQLPHQAQQRSSRRQQVDLVAPAQPQGRSQQTGEAAHQHQLQPRQQEPFSSAAALMQPAARAVQHLIAAAPPLMFLGACCYSDAAHPAAAAAAGHAGAVAEADIDGCPLAAVPAVKAPAGRQQH